MSKLKLFAGTAVWVPHTWKDRVSGGPHAQLDVAIVAASKPAAVGMLVQAGESESSAAAIVRACKWRRDGMSNPVRDLVVAGVIDMDQSGTYVWKRYSKDSRIARVDVDGMPIVGHFRFHDDGPAGWHMSAEKVTAAPEAR